ncbi:hypothetical protein GCM10028796_04780 [Ramlibacter monticola]
METSPVAWYAAILSTVVFAWDLTKWWRAEPRLRISAHAEVSYLDAEIVHRDRQPDGAEVACTASYCHVEIVNTGGRPTTLLEVEAIARQKRGNKPGLELSSSNFNIHRGSDQLPAKLAPGEMWSARIDMRNLAALQRIGAVHIRARAAYRARAIEVQMRQAGNLLDGTPTPS